MASGAAREPKAEEERFEGLADVSDQLRQQFEDLQIPGMLAPVANAWRRDGTSSRIAGPVFFRWLAKRGLEREPTEGELLNFAIERGMLTVS